MKKKIFVHSDSKHLKKGQVYEIGAELAMLLIERGLAVLFEKAQDFIEEKREEKAANKKTKKAKK